ncbi:MAG: class I SAM-dependent methyltransferase [Nitrospirae bacterium]|nr:class I SAM-dependent methyltransferase [Nitrospirota bacterium]
MVKKIFEKMFNSAMDLNKMNILSMLEPNTDAKLLDLGCNDGVWTTELANAAGTKNIYGIEIVEERIKLSKEKGIIVQSGDLNESFPFEDSMFDIIHANQVIEHIAYLDAFILEIYRVLKPGGYVIISTENGSSWHNIFASIAGWQIFSLTNMTYKRLGMGNPLAIHRSGALDIGLSSWTHKTIFNYLGLKEFIEAYDFHNITIKGSGYYPLPASLGKLDVRHAHFITIKGYKR